MLRITALLLTTIIPLTVHGQSAREILEEVIERDLERKSSVQNYIVNQCTMGVPVMLYYEKVARNLDGQSIETFRLVPPNEISERQNDGFTLTPQEMELFAQGLEDMGEAIGQEVDNSGLPTDMLMPAASYDEPWASPDPRVMTGSMAMFMRAAAAAEQDRQLNGTNTDVASSAEQLGQLIDSAELVGNESVEGRPAFHIRTDDVNYNQTANGGEQFDVDSVSIWIDREHYVPLRVRMNGIADVEGESREMFIEMLSSDYRQIGPLYESTRQVMSMGGVLTPEQQAQLEEAQVQLAEARQQLAQLDGQQKQMLENMLGPQIAMMENLVNNGSIQVETLTPRIRVNAGLPDQQEMASAMFDTSTCGSSGGLFGALTAGGNPGAAASSGGQATQNGGAATGAGFGALTAAAAASPGNQSPQNGGVATSASSMAASQECLEQKIEEAQANQPRRRGLGGLLGGVGRAVSRLGNLDIAGLASSLYEPGASEADIEERARELGLSDEDIAECRAPQTPEAAPALDF